MLAETLATENPGLVGSRVNIIQIVPGY